MNRSFPDVIDSRADSRTGFVVLGVNCLDFDRIPTAYSAFRIECLVEYCDPRCRPHRWCGDFAAADERLAFARLADHFSGGAVRRLYVTDVRSLMDATIDR